MSNNDEKWIFMLPRGASEEQTEAFAAKIDALGKAQGFKTVDHFRGTLLVQCNEAFARQVEKDCAGELRTVAKETLIPHPGTRIKPPGA